MYTQQNATTIKTAVNNTYSRLPLSNVMAHVVALTHQPLPTKDWAWTQTSPCRICGGQTGTRAGFSL